MEGSENMEYEAVKEVPYEHAKRTEIRERNMLIVGLYAFLSGFTPDIPMSVAYRFVNDVAEDVLKN